VRVGTDGLKLPEASKRGPVGALELAHDLGAEGLFFRSMLDLSPSLDRGALRAVRERADELDMYLESGVGKTNPFAMPEAPELRAIGDGDVLLGFRRMMEAGADIGVFELWSATANLKPHFFGRMAYDRFRTDADWADQLAATEKFLKKLAPIARDLGIHINLETHEEITSFELVRLVEAVGPDVTGVVFDTHNVLQRIEHPVWAARRLAPYVRQTHLKDGVAAYGPDGLVSQVRDFGTGMIDFAEIIPILASENPVLNFSLENQDMRDGPLIVHPVIEIDNADFLAGHPDLSREEHEAFMDLVRCFDGMITRGQRPGIEEFAKGPFNFENVCANIRSGLSLVRGILMDAGLSPVITPLDEHVARG
jgi:sugar phosphate isomerase/epimerase